MIRYDESDAGSAASDVSGSEVEEEEVDDEDEDEEEKKEGTFAQMRVLRRGFLHSYAYEHDADRCCVSRTSQS